MTQDRINVLRRKVEWAEKKANEAAASDAPWALKNLRLYQNLMVRYMADLAAAEV